MSTKNLEEILGAREATGVVQRMRAMSHAKRVAFMNYIAQYYCMHCGREHESFMKQCSCMRDK